MSETNGEKPQAPAPQDEMLPEPEDITPDAPARRRRRFGRTFAMLAELAVVLIVLLFLGVGFFLWRLTSGPFDVGFARDYIEQALHDPVSGYRVRLGEVVLEWPDAKSPLTLRVKRANLIGRDHRVVGIDELTIGISGPALITGRVMPVTVAIDRPAVRMMRTEDGRVSFGLENEDDTDNDTPVSVRIREALEQLDGKINPRSPLSRLRSFEITGASLLMEDHVLGMSWYVPNLDMALKRDAAGVSVTSTLALPATGGRPSRLQFDAVYSSRDAGAMRARLLLGNVDPRVVTHKIPSLSWLTLQGIGLDGTADVAMDRDLNVTAARLQLSAAEGELAAEGTYEKPIPFRDLAVDASYNGARKTIGISRLGITLDGVAIAAEGEAVISDTSVRLPLRLTIPELKQEKIAALWPESLRGESIETWLVHRMSEGTVSNIDLALVVTRERPGVDAEWATDVTDIKGSFDIEGMTVDYRAPLMPARGIRAKGSFENDTLSFDISAARIGEMNVTKGRVSIDHIVDAGAGTADISVNLSGPLPEVFKYIESEPIGMTGERLGLNAAQVKGQADLGVNVNFPTTKDLLAEQVKVTVGGTLRDVTLPDAVKTLPLTGGSFDLTVGDGQVVLKGKEGRLDGRLVTFEWQQYLESAGKPYSSRITADITTDDDLRAKMGLGLEDWVAGPLPASIVYTTLADGQATVDVKADVGPAMLMVKPFAFEKPAGVAGTATCTVRLKNGFLQEVKDLTVQAKDIDIKKADLAFETVKGASVLRRGTFTNAVLGASAASLTFSVAPDGQMKMDVKGGTLDARPFLDSSLKKKDLGQEDKPGTPVVAIVAVDRMITHKDRAVDKVSLDLDLNRDGLVNQLKLDAAAAGGAPLSLRVGPDAAGRMAVRFEAADAGETLRAFGIYENVQGGTLVVDGVATDPARPRVLSGVAQISDFRVVNAPALAQLVSIISPAGLLQVLRNDGLYFARLESQFDWHMRPRGDLYVLNDGRTSGSSLGLTFGGVIDKEKGIIDLEGHVVPLSGVNNLIGNIPLVGDILTGGNGALFAATYTLRGPVKEPKVSVNPLSVLAPGILRRILFEGGN